MKALINKRSGMMKCLFLAGVFIIIIIPITAGVVEGGTDFREVNWGMSPEQAKKTEPGDKLTGEMPAVLIYEGEIAGIKASIFYLFDDSKLIRGLYSIDTSRQDTIVIDYETIRAFLLEQYGEPDEVKMGVKEEISTGELDPANPEDLYTLVIRKAVSPETIWKKGATRIYLQLTEKDGLVAVMVDFIPDNFFPPEK
jgi:hypothetical protein